MEHRWDVRRTVFLDVSVYREDRLVARCFSGDLSRGGLFLETDEFTLAKNTPVELDVLLTLGQGTVGFHFHAVVVHVAGGGLGLMFRKTRAQLSNTLLDLLSTHRLLSTSVEESVVPYATAPKRWSSSRAQLPLSGSNDGRLPAQFY